MGEGRVQHYSDIAVEFINLKVDVNVTAGYEAVVAVKQATSTIPIVVAGVGNPVGYNLVARLARPGANITSFSTQSSDAGPRRRGDPILSLRDSPLLHPVRSPRGTELKVDWSARAGPHVGVERSQGSRVGRTLF